MSQNSEKRENRKNKLNDHYRLVVIDDDTLREVRSTRFSMSKLITGFILSIFSIMALTWCLVAFTPLKHLVPGYADITNNAVYMELSEKIDALEKDITAQRTYTEGFKNLLNPSGTDIEDLSNEDRLQNNFSNKISYKHSSSTNISLEHYYFCKPLKGEISAGFDADETHYGVDIVAPKNTPILNILDGVVINSDWSDKTGYTISIQHQDNLVSIFKHNSVLLKRTGERVKKGEALAIIGNTGELSSGPHVHFELWNNGIALDPENYLSFN